MLCAWFGQLGLDLCHAERREQRGLLRRAAGLSGVGPATLPTAPSRVLRASNGRPSLDRGWVYSGSYDILCLESLSKLLGEASLSRH